MINTGLIDLHSVIRYFILALFLGSLFTAYYGFLGQRSYGGRISRLHLVTRMLVNLQALIGFALYFLDGFYRAWTGFGLSGDRLSFFAFGHLIGMLIGIALINIGHQKSVKAKTDREKYKHIAVFYSLGLLVIFLLIPWPFFHSWATWFSKG